MPDDLPVSVAVAATLVPCPRCLAPLSYVNGKPAVPLTFWTRSGLPVVTPHFDGCIYRGKEVT